jgi:hypothetical protein
MKLHELLNDLSWIEIQEALLRNYKDTEKSIKKYEEVFFKLIKMNPVENTMRISISYVEKDLIEDNDFQPYWHVCGLNGTLQKNSNDADLFQEADKEFLNSEVSYAIEMTPWNEWLGMEIDQETANNVELTRADIVAHCMWEMTFFGFEEEKIQEILNDLNEKSEEIKNMSEEDLKKNTISLDELKEKIDKGNSKDE